MYGYVGVAWPRGDDDRVHGELPELVIRQHVDLEELTFYCIQDKKCFEVTEGMNVKHMQIFNRDKVVWLIEPGATQQPIGIVSDKQVPPFLATVSPNSILYHGVTKDIAAKMYMKTYTLDELLTIGRHMRPSLPANLQSYYTDELITERFYLYGGIFRRVLPTVINQLQQHQHELQTALSLFPGKKLDIAAKYLVTDTSSTMESYMVHWDPLITYEDPNDTTKTIKRINFFYQTTNFASSYVVDHLRKLNDNLTRN
jgi:hypothetical protein